MTKPEGINLDIQPHHVKRGAEQAHANNRRERRVNQALLGHASKAMSDRYLRGRKVTTAVPNARRL